jgi:hypothetical protein
MPRKGGMNSDHFRCIKGTVTKERARTRRRRNDIYELKI